MESYYDDVYDNIYDAYDAQPDDYGIDPDIAEYMDRDIDDQDDFGDDFDDDPAGERMFDYRDDEEDAIQNVSEGRPGDGGAGDDLDFAPDFRLLTAQAPIATTGIMRRLRTPLEVAIDQIKVMVNVEEISESRRRNIVASLETLPNLPNYNIGLMIIATQYFLDKYKMDGKDFNRFIRNLGSKIYIPRDRNGKEITVNKFDLVRYLTILEEKR